MLDPSAFGHVVHFSPDHELIWHSDYIAQHGKLFYFGFGEDDMFGPCASIEDAETAFDALCEMDYLGSTSQ